MGSVEGGRLLATPLTPSQATASRPATELGVVGESSLGLERGFVYLLAGFMMYTLMLCYLCGLVYVQVRQQCQ